MPASVDVCPSNKHTFFLNAFFSEGCVFRKVRELLTSSQRLLPKQIPIFQKMDP